MAWDELLCKEASHMFGVKWINMHPTVESTCNTIISHSDTINASLLTPPFYDSPNGLSELS